MKQRIIDPLTGLPFQEPIQAGTWDPAKVSDPSVLESEAQSADQDHDPGDCPFGWTQGPGESKALWGSTCREADCAMYDPATGNCLIAVLGSESAQQARAVEVSAVMLQGISVRLESLSVILSGIDTSLSKIAQEISGIVVSTSGRG